MSTLRARLITNQRIKPINPVLCGSEDCDPQQEFGPCARHCWLWHFVVSGKGVFETPRGKYTLGPGDIFIIRPYEITYYSADASDPWSYIWIGFTSDIPLPAVLTNSDTLHAPFLSSLFKDAVETMYFEKTNLNSGAYEHYLSGIILQISSLLMRDNVSTTSTAETYVRAAISIIEAEYSTGITVASLAERLHLNRSYFSEIFRQITGMPPHKYLTAYRMRCAEELLSVTGASVTATALSVGYPDVFAFSRAYKHHFGHPPTRNDEPHESVVQK